MPDGGCCTCEAMMCDGEDRVVDVKKKEGVRVGERRCYKGQSVSEKCTKGIQYVGQIAWGTSRARIFFEVEKESGGGSVGSYAPLSC